MMYSRIMVVDDDKDMLELIGILLESEGFVVQMARSGHEALEMLEKATPDLFLLDVAMPGMDGVELCRRIRASARTYQTPVIFLSATGDSQTIDRSLAAGGTDYLRKLPSREILVSTINKVLGENGQRSRRRASE